jgi:hypothetical protein
MKVGILILAHNNFEQLLSLVDSLKSDFSVFVHIDAKSDILVDHFASEKNVWVIKKHRIYWGDVNMIYAVLDLLKMAYNQSCDYYMLISGMDMPIRPCWEIIKEIEKKPESNYVDYAELPREDWPQNGGFDRMTLYWEPIENKEKPTIYNRMYALFRNLQRYTELKRKLFPIKYYGGSTWFNISREVVKFILNFTAENPIYLRQFKYTRNTDEIYFHTLILNSGFASKIVNDDKRYIDWASGPEFPKTLRLDDYEKITASGDFFARKFDEKVDAEIIDCIKVLL